MIYFRPTHLKLLGEAAFIAEETVSEFFSLSPRDWLRFQYEVRTLKDLPLWPREEKAFARLLRSIRPRESLDHAAERDVFYIIHLHDDRIIKRTAGFPGLLFPFLIYVLTHELVHIVRFAKHLVYFWSPYPDREEVIVHGLTRKILKPLKIKNMDKVLSRFDRFKNEEVDCYAYL